MKKLLLALCFAALYSCTQAQPARPAVNTEDADYIKANYTKMEKQITMRDGKKLWCSIYLPKDQSVKYPILMTRTPYNAAPYGDAFKTTLGQNMLLAKEGFIFVYADVRGRWMSEGDFVDVRPQLNSYKSKTDIDESTDTYDTIDWLVKN